MDGEDVNFLKFKIRKAGIALFFRFSFCLSINHNKLLLIRL